MAFNPHNIPGQTPNALNQHERELAEVLLVSQALTVSRDQPTILSAVLAASRNEPTAQQLEEQAKIESLKAMEEDVRRREQREQNERDDIQRAIDLNNKEQEDTKRRAYGLQVALFNEFAETNANVAARNSDREFDDLYLDRKSLLEGNSKSEPVSLIAPRSKEAAITVTSVIAKPVQPPAGAPGGSLDRKHIQDSQTGQTIFSSKPAAAKSGAAAAMVSDLGGKAATASIAAKDNNAATASRVVAATSYAPAAAPSSTKIPVVPAKSNVSAVALGAHKSTPAASVSVKGNEVEKPKKSGPANNAVPNAAAAYTPRLDLKKLHKEREERAAARKLKGYVPAPSTVARATKRSPTSY